MRTPFGRFLIAVGPPKAGLGKGNAHPHEAVFTGVGRDDHHAVERGYLTKRVPDSVGRIVDWVEKVPEVGCVRGRVGPRG